MELEEDIKVVEELINASRLAHLYEGNKYYESMEKLLHYIKEESIPRAVVEEMLKGIEENIELFIDNAKNCVDEERAYWKKVRHDACMQRNILQKILTKGKEKC